MRHTNYEYYENLSDKNLGCKHLLCLATTNILNLVRLLCMCVEFLLPSQPNGVMSSAVSLPNHTFTAQA